MSIETYATTNGDGQPDYQCKIRDTNRATDSVSAEIFGRGFFILEVKAAQTVFVVPAGSQLSRDDVTDLVLAGFDQDSGGLLTFRSLLRQSSSFSTVLSVEALDDFTPSNASTSAPTEAPTIKPSAEPTGAPPTDLPSASPTGDPSTRAPTVIPTTPPSKSLTISPTQVPNGGTSLPPSDKPSQATTSDYPSMSPSMLRNPSRSTPGPSFSPTLDDQSQDASSTPPDRTPLIFGAVAGAAACILASCFFIFCVWFPICKRSARGEALNDDDGGGGAENGAGDAVSGLQCRPASWTTVVRVPTQEQSNVVPVEVELDADNESLADTTLGDATTGDGEALKRSRDKGTHSPLLLKSNKKQQRKAEEARAKQSLLSGSFDENSVYTSAVEAQALESIPAQPVQSSFAKLSSMLLPPSLSRTLEYEEDIVFPMSDSLPEPASRGSLQNLGLLESRTTKKKNAVGSNSSRSSFGAPDAAQSDEDRALEIAKSMDAGTKGFDPFNEDEVSESSGVSFDGENEGHERVQRQTYSPDPDERASPAPSSSASGSKRTKPEAAPAVKTSDRVSGTSPEEEKQEVEINGTKDEPSPSTKLASVDSSDQTENNSLLRSILEDARRLSRGTGFSSRSRQSAPPRLLKGGEDSSRSPRLTDERDLDDYLRKAAQGEGRVRSTVSLGSSASLQRRAETPGTDQLKASGSHSGNRYFTPPHRTRYLDRGARPSPQHFVHPPRSSQKSSAEASSFSKLLTSLGAPDQSKPASASVSESEDGISRGSLVFGPRHFVHPARGLEREERDILGSPSRTLPATPDSQVMEHPPTPMTSPAPEDGMGTLGAGRRDSMLDLRHPSNAMPDTPMSSPGVLGIAVKPKRKGPSSPSDDASSGSEGLSNPWLYDAIEQTLGPRSPAADMESISGRSNRSGKSHKSNRSGVSSKSRQSSRTSDTGKRSRSSKRRTSASSRSSPQVRKSSSGTPSSRESWASTTKAMVNVAAEESKDSPEAKGSADEKLTPRTLEYDLQRLDVTISEVIPTDNDQMTTSTITASTAGASRSTLSSYRPPPRRSKAKRVTVVVPPGKLGVVLADRHDGKGTVVSEVRPSSAMVGMLNPGDKVGTFTDWSYECSRVSDCASAL